MGHTLGIFCWWFFALLLLKNLIIIKLTGGSSHANKSESIFTASIEKCEQFNYWAIIKLYRF